MSRTFFHSTISRNVRRIMKEGLIPARGMGLTTSTSEEVRRLAPIRPFVFATTTLERADEWAFDIGETFNERVTILSFQTEQTPFREDEEEVLFSSAIPPKGISIVKELE